MSDIDRVISITKIAVQAVELLETAAKTAATAISTAKAQLKDALHEAEQMRTRLASDRAAADKALEDNFKP